MIDFSFVLWFGLGLSVISAVGSLLFSETFTKRFASRLLSFSLLFGVIASVGFLLSGGERLLVGTTGLFFGMPFELDRLSALFYLLVSGVGAVVTWYATSYTEANTHHYRLRSLHALTAVFIVGMQGVLLSPAPISFLFFWEVMSIASFFLVFADRQETSIKAGLLYLIMTHLGAGALLAGFLLLSNGSLVEPFSEFSASAGITLVSFFLFLFGFGSKAGLWPFHVWLPEAHPQAPSHISALMSGVMLKIALYGFLRLLFVLQPLPSFVAIVVIILGLLSGVYGALYAVVERDVKRLLAYSSMENMGLLFTMVGVLILATNVGLFPLASVAFTAVLVHAFAHAVFKSGLFMGAGTLITQLHTRSLEAMGGIAKRAPLFSFSLLLLALGASALPPFSGFIGEWMFLRELTLGLAQIVSSHPVLSAVLVVVLSVFAFVGGLGAFAMIKMFGIGFLGEPRTSEADAFKEPSAGFLFPIFLCAVFTLLYGLYWVDHLTALLLFFALLFVFVLRYLFSDRTNERVYHAWDCGQPITARMEYTATAFSSPLRFFFRQILRTSKRIDSVPLVATNPWMTTKTFSLDIRRLWFDLLYLPIAREVLRLSTFVRRLQNGVIQFYIALILLALVFVITFLV